MPKPQQPELRSFMEKRLKLKLNARRQVSGIMRGFDQFMNIVLDKATDEKDGSALGMVVIRGNSIETIEVDMTSQP
uniref:Small nuclear ribonucleoprotein G n=1 Tax=Ulva partita TaxID=1605170 RepID=A0A1C9ZRT6_9CHLO|nr:small nuclear ribonucleo protein polypeptide G [Ulva partita]